MSKTVRGWILVVMIVTLWTAATADGEQQGPPGRWWRNARVISQLKLSDGEIQQLEKAFEASRLRMIKLKGRVESEQFKLQNLVEKPNFNEKAIKAQHRRLEAARTALSEEQLGFYVRVRKIIGYERYRKLEAMQPLSRKN
jgi:Spy/CpxP family protein refolding chaperone